MTPGDLLRYEINFQISDYKTLGNLVLTDWLSDGQRLEELTAPLPRLTVRDQFGVVQADFDNFNFGNAANRAWRIDPNIPCPCTPAGFPAGLRADRYTFNISRLMMLQAGPHPRHLAGLLTGGLASLPGSTTPATGTLVFYVRIRDKFSYLLSYLPSSGFIFVDKHDPLVNCVEVRGDLFPNQNAPAVPMLPTGITASDDSSTGIRIVGGPFTKSVYATNEMILPAGSPPPNLAPGDRVTFRLTKTLPTGDAENVVLRDFPPLPVLRVMDPNNANVTSYPWQPPVGIPSPAPPASGGTSFGPAHTLPNTSFPTMVLATPPNELAFSYLGQIFNGANTPYVIDILFTMTVNHEPLADGLILNNEAQERETSTFNEPFSLVSLAQIKVAEPNLRITKGVVATDNSLGTFVPVLGGQPAFTAPGGGCPRFTPLLTSTAITPALGGTPVISDLSGVDANDRVTFAIIVENLGHSPKGAFDIIIKDTLDAKCFTKPGNLCVRRGDGALLPATGDLFAGGLEFTDPSPTSGALAAYHATSGQNLLVITFDATFLPVSSPACCTNKSDVVRYSNREGGANFVTAGLGAQLSDTARVCSAPQVQQKCLVATSETHTTFVGNVGGLMPAVAIGEIIRYRLFVTLPEGAIAPTFEVRDFLPAGLQYLGAPTLVFVSDTGIASLLGNDPGLNTPGGGGNVNPARCTSPTPTFPFPANQIIAPAGCGGTVRFQIPGLINSDNDPDREYLIIEFNALVCNVAGNQPGTALANTFGVFAAGAQVGPLSAPLTVRVVEPILNVTKQVTTAPQQIGSPVTYTVTFQNLPGPFATTAFDVNLLDLLPACFGPVSLLTVTDGNLVPLVLAANNTLPAPNRLEVTLASVAVGQTVIVTYQASLICADCSQTINTAVLTWTSLPGAGSVPNPTGQTTPGATGAANGERNGSGGVNDYIDTATVGLCADLNITKTTTGNSPTATGTFTAGLNGNYTINVVNLGNAPAVGPVTVTDTLPAGLTFVGALATGWTFVTAGQTVTFTYNGLAIPPGGSFPPITLTVAIAGSAGGTILENCATVQSPNDSNPANNISCVNVSVMVPGPCLGISNQMITCLPNGTYSYTFSVANLCSDTIASLGFVQLPPGMTVTPNPLPLTPALAPGQVATLMVTIAYPGCGPANVCFSIDAYAPNSTRCCVLAHCLDLPGCCATRTYTFNADFAEGTLLNVNSTTVADQLQINNQISPFPYVWIANSRRGTVVKIDANATASPGAVLGEYRSAPINMAKDPSRTTVDKFGNCWVGNRLESSSSTITINGVPTTANRGSVTRYAILIGGIRGNRIPDGTSSTGFAPHLQPDANGQYLENPTYNSGAIDRDGDGFFKTSRGAGDILPWSNAGGVDDNGGVSTAEDEAIITYIRTAGTGARSLAVDANNDLWVGGYANRVHEQYSGLTGPTYTGHPFLPLIFSQMVKPNTLYTSSMSGGYGAVIDGNGIIWSSSGPSALAGLLRLNPVSLNGINTTPAAGNYGLSIDPCTGFIWHTAYGPTSDNTSLPSGVFVRNPAGVVTSTHFHGQANARGVCVDQNGNVFVAHSQNNSVGHLRTDGTFIGNISVGSGPFGVAVDNNGKIWVSCFSGNKVQRIDPNAGPLMLNNMVVGSGGYPVGMLDLDVSLNPPLAFNPPMGTDTTASPYNSLGAILPADPYNYSDQTGYSLLGVTSPGGFWNVIRDGCVNGLDWGTVSWTSMEPAGTSITVQVRASDTQLGLASQVFTSVSNGESFCGTGITGRFLEIHTSFSKTNGCNAPSPILYDLTVECSCDPRNHRPTIVGPGPFFSPITNANVSVTTTIAVNDADGNPLTVTWSEGGVVLQTNNVPAGAPGATTAMLDFTRSFGPGPHVITVVVSDGAGGVSRTNVVVQISDTKGPVITVPGGRSVAGFTGVIPDFLLGLIAVDDHTPAGEIVLNQRPLPGLPVGQGVFSVELTARDLAGNTSTAQTFYAVSPVVGISSPANYATFTAPATVSVSTTVASNVTGVASVRLLNGGAGVGTNSAAPYNFVLTNLTAGTYILTAQAVSTNGLFSTSDGVIISVVSPGALALGPTLAGVMLNNRDLTFSLLTEPGVTCYVEYTATLSPPNWILLRTIVGDGSVVPVTATTTNAARSFFRVRRQ